jgi:hypothetical protein
MKRNHPTRIPLLALAAQALLCAGELAVAQDEIVDDRLEPQRVGNVAANVRQPAVGFVVNGVQNHEQQFDQLLFGRFGGAGVYRNRLESALSLKLDDVERITGITPSQKRKLLLAGRGDIKRFFDKVDEAKRLSANPGANARFNNIWQAVQPLQMELNTGMFDDSSLLAKTITHTLENDQLTRYDEVLRERKRDRYRTSVGWFVVRMDKELGLDHEQREKLLALMMAETKPPKRFGQNDYWFMMSQAARISESSLKPIFDDIQWKLVSRQLLQARSMRPFLEANGVVLDDDNKKTARAPARPAMAVIPANPLAPADRVEKPVVPDLGAKPLR